jgi:hypothetical protein
MIASWESSGQDKTGYCESHEINVHTFNYWLQKYKLDSGEEPRKPGGVKFVELAVQRAPGPGSMPVLELCYPNGVRLVFKELVSAKYLEPLIRILS